jgi:DNA modification methylase
VNDRAAYANADARLLPLPNKSVHMIATSPPYWGLRSYATGDNKHAELGAEKVHDCGAWARRTIIGYRAAPEFEEDGDGNMMIVGSLPEPIYGPPEKPCGACYVCNMRTWAAEMWRVLRDDGVMFLNLGDSYAAQGGGCWPAPTNTGNKAAGGSHRVNNRPLPGLKPKDLVGIPWRVALALQADGWYLRSDVIWAKPNPMPESVTDRPTKAHEYVFLLTKSPRYFWDGEAVRENFADERMGNPGAPSPKSAKIPGQSAHTIGSKVWDRGKINGGRNLRSVWTIATAPYAGSHFATWPPALVERMVKAGTSERGVCPECGKPWGRVVEKGEAVNAPRNPNDVQPYPAGSGYNNGNGATTLHKVREVKTVEWRPTCTCNQDGLDLKPDDFEIILTPTGERAGDDPSLIVGRAGYNRPRDDNEGQRPITRYEQRRYAAQLRQSADKGEMASEAGSAFSHYTRTDHSGARPIPQQLLDKWIDAGWLERVEVPEFRPHAPVPAIVLDPFCGSGTTLLVARQLGRVGLGFDLSETYLRDNAAVRLGHDKLAAWGRGIVDTGDYADLFRAVANGDGARSEP